MADQRKPDAERKAVPPDDIEQSKRFEETARKHEAEDSGKIFDKAIEFVVQEKKRG